MKGFIGLPALLAIVAVLFVAAGGTAWYLQQKTPLSATLATQGDTAAFTAQDNSGAASSSGATIVVPTGQQGTLLVSYKDIQLRFVSGIPQQVASGLCALVYADTCIWNENKISAAPLQIANSAEGQPKIQIDSPEPGVTLSYGTIVPITIRDFGPAGRHRAYLIHRNLLGEVDEVHEAHITAESGDTTKTLMWDGNEIFVNESGTEQVAQLAAGHYWLEVVNIDTDVAGTLPQWINLVTDIRGKDVPTSDLLKPYVLPGTPILNSYWDGRGIFYNGTGGVDTLQIVGKRDDVAIFRGVDMPDKNQYQTLVFFRRTDGVVLVTTNVEIIKFDDQTLTAADLVAQFDGPPSILVAGMSKYTDPDFGFSFWYPSSWSVTAQARNVPGYGTALIKKTLTIAGTGSQKIVLDEVYSPNHYVDIATAKSGLSDTYLFDSAAHTWMYSSNFTGTVVTKAANVSDNTMGGLHLLYGNGSYGLLIAVPLSASNFVVARDGVYNTLGLLRTVVASDPAVATPQSTAQQQAVVESEKAAYANQ